MTALYSLVELHTKKPHCSVQHKAMTQERIDWMAIGQELGRVHGDCAHKWDSILASKMKKGPFTPVEDALIRQRVLEWGDKGQGLWASLQEEMGRHANSINQRWTMSLRKI